MQRYNKNMNIYNKTGNGCIYSCNISTQKGIGFPKKSCRAFSKIIGNFLENHAELFFICSA